MKTTQLSVSKARFYAGADRIAANGGMNVGHAVAASTMVVFRKKGDRDAWVAGTKTFLQPYDEELTTNRVAISAAEADKNLKSQRGYGLDACWDYTFPNVL